jgi:predicted nucleic acid-binding protein
VAAGHEIAVSAIVLHERTFGVSTSKHPQRSSGHIRTTLAGSGMSIGPFDILIAGQALSRSLIMVTANVRELSRLKQPIVVDWSR